MNAYLGTHNICTPTSQNQSAGAYFGLFRKLLGSIPRYLVLERRRIQENWLIFKNHLLQFQAKQRWQESLHRTPWSNIKREHTGNRTRVTKMMQEKYRHTVQAHRNGIRKASL